MCLRCAARLRAAGAGHDQRWSRAAKRAVAILLTSIADILRRPGVGPEPRSPRNLIEPPSLSPSSPARACSSVAVVAQLRASSRSTPRSRSRSRSPRCAAVRLRCAGAFFGAARCELASPNLGPARPHERKRPGSASSCRHRTLEASTSIIESPPAFACSAGRGLN